MSKSMNPDDLRTWMWGRAIEMLDEAERLHKQFFQLGRPASRRPAWNPPVDIYEFDGTLHIVVALPGVNAERLQVLSEGSALVVVGERRVPTEGRAGTIHRLEIPHGRFERRIEGLPPGLRLARHELRDGCLFLTFRKV